MHEHKLPVPRLPKICKRASGTLQSLSECPSWWVEVMNRDSLFRKYRGNGGSEDFHDSIIDQEVCCVHLGRLTRLETIRVGAESGPPRVKAVTNNEANRKRNRQEIRSIFCS